MSTEISPFSHSGLPEGLAGHRLLTSDEAARRAGRRQHPVPAGRPADLLAWIDDHTENPDGNVGDPRRHVPGSSACRVAKVAGVHLDRGPPARDLSDVAGLVIPVATSVQRRHISTQIRCHLSVQQTQLVMTWELVLVVIALSGLLAWGFTRQRRHAGEMTMNQVKAQIHRRGDVGGPYEG